MITDMKSIQGRNLQSVVENSDFAVLPLGSVEYHGPHAPYGTDLILAEGFGQLLSGQFSAVVYPGIAYSACPGKTVHYPGTISIGTDTFIQYLRDVLAGILATGFSKILLLNAHDANMSVARAAAEWVTGDFDPSSVLILNWFQMLTTDETNEWGTFDGTGRGHGGPYEISAVQAMCPDCVEVKPEDAELVTPQPLTKLPYVLVERSPKGWNGYTGKIHETSLATGRRIVDGVTKNINAILEQWATD
jgi:creatinine amidohydrolase